MPFVAPARDEFSVIALSLIDLRANAFRICRERKPGSPIRIMLQPVAEDPPVQSLSANAPA
jgi:hypothetical protein